MPLRHFNSDLAAAAAKATAGSLSKVTSVKKGDSDGELVVTYSHEALASPLPVRLLCQDVGGYPDFTNYVVFTDDPDPPPQLLAAMAQLQDSPLGSRVMDMITALKKSFSKVLQPSSAGDQGDDEMTDFPEEEDYEQYEYDEDDDMYDYDDDDDDTEDNGDHFGLSSTQPLPRPGAPSTSARAAKELRNRIKRDFRCVRDAGFKVGILTDMNPEAMSSIASISIRASKLGLSDDVLEAWEIKSSEYIVLLYQVENPYKPYETVVDALPATTKLSFRVGKCAHYKPALLDALAALARSNLRPRHDSDRAMMGDGARDTPEASFAKIMISNSLDDFMNQSFVSLVKLRHMQDVSWDQANTLLLDRISHTDDQMSSLGPDVEMVREARDDKFRSSILGHDHLARDATGPRSLPLVAMEFAMRYLVKCTKYCLRCHRNVGDGFEALKPYVCSNPLCLFQYMAMGFGPSIEHEILSQPQVVDLLVSFCYSSLGSSQPGRIPSLDLDVTGRQSYPIREIPAGLQLKIPDFSAKGIHGYVNRSYTKFIMADLRDASALRVDQWVAFCAREDAERAMSARQSPAKTVMPSASLGPTNLVTASFAALARVTMHHSRIRRVDLASLTVHLDYMASSSEFDGNGDPAATAVLSRRADDQDDPKKMYMLPYAADFDDLQRHEQVAVMRDILDTLPPISVIKEYLESHFHADLRSVNTVSPAAATLLEWIVASNRSCIFQTETASAEAGSSHGADPARVSGMDGWVQFRFAQGSPDKELRFHEALRGIMARKKLRHPTIFAWHGSALSNWHSIVRTGLDYARTLNGRAYGNGVYFSKDFDTSRCYSHLNGVLSRAWPNAELHIANAVSLNEIINCPDEWTSQCPHYVVQHNDWHQCRFLFVQARSLTSGDSRNPPVKHPNSIIGDDSRGEWFEQDPSRQVKGPGSTSVKIPMAAVPWASMARPGVCRGGDRNEDEDDEVDEDPRDVEFLFSDDGQDDDGDEPPAKLRGSSVSSVDTVTARTTRRPLTPAAINMQVTIFQPGSLDLASLPRLQPPTWATPAATKGIASEVRRLQAVQSQTPLHELGWYIDFDTMENMFQWIVELHSFDLELPLARDMKQAGVSSIVCEMRFGAQFPFSPPFVRIIRPRFVPYGLGGGGHVTAGGALCMELLTNTGWSPANGIEAVLLQVRLALCSLDPQPAKLDMISLRSGAPSDYGIGEAVDAYMRAAASHGWVVPEDLRQTTFFAT